MGKTLGEKIREIRLKLGKNMEEFGNLVEGANKGLVSRWENDKSIPGLQRLHIIAKLGDISFEELMSNDDINSLLEKGSSLKTHLEISLFNIKDYIKIIGNLQNQLDETLNKENSLSEEMMIESLEFDLQRIREISGFLKNELDIHNKVMEDVVEINDIIKSVISYETLNTISQTKSTSNISLESLFNTEVKLTLNNKALTTKEKMRALEILKLVFEK